MNNEFNISKTCCFTGHRSIPVAQEKTLGLRLLDILDNLIDVGYDTFISGGALGFDTFAARAVIYLRERNPNIRLVLALPCRNQPYHWSPADTIMYQRVLDAADKAILVSENYSSGCMHKRNRFMVDNSSVCISYLTRSTGGTAYTINYAEKKGLKVINIACGNEEQRQSDALLHH